MDGPANVIAVLNGGSNDYDRQLCFDAPVNYDTGNFQYEYKTLADARSEIIAALGFLDPLEYTRLRTLGQMRADVARRLGWAAMVAAGKYPPGTAALIDGWINDAQQIVFSRLEMDTGAIAAPPRMEADSDYSTIDYIPILNLATALAKAHYGHPDAKVWLQLADAYVADVARRSPPMLRSTVDTYLRMAQEHLYFRYSMLRTERWWAWQTTPGRDMYDVPIDCTKALDFRKLTGAWISDNGGRALTLWAGQTSWALGTYVTPTIPNGFEYQVTTAGTGGTVDPLTGKPPEPTWPTTLNATVTLSGVGGAVLTARAAASARMLPLKQGISPGEFNAPGHAMPWCFELREYLHVWPVPDKVYVIWLKGHLGLRKLSADTDALTIDWAPVFSKALAMCKRQFKQDPGTLEKDVEVYLARVTSAQHGITRYIPNPRDYRTVDGVEWWQETPPAVLPRPTWR